MPQPVPHHLGLIMDGNGRWAAAQQLPRAAGHHAGLEHIRCVLNWCREEGIHTVSGYLWSRENWRRPARDVQHMRLLLRTYGRPFAQQLHAQQIRILHSGSLVGLTAEEQAIITEAVALTRDNCAQVFNLVFNHSGRAELTEVAQRFAQARIDPTQIDEAAISAALATAPLPDIDLIIRTAGEQRLSNFMLWQSAYALAYTIAAPWPAITRDDLQAVLGHYRHVQARAATRSGYQQQTAQVGSDGSAMGNIAISGVQKV